MICSEIKFDIRFITPLLIGSAENSSTGDSIGLTGKALRGAWRFWFRAMVGGIMKDPDPSIIAKLEEKIFGSLNCNTFRLKVTADSDNQTREQIDRLPPPSTNSKRNQAPFFNPTPEGNKFHIHILPRIQMREEDTKVLLASIWVWVHLGTVGNRSRRGFGSPVITNDSNFSKMLNSLLSEVQGNIFTLQPTCENFKNDKDLSNYLTENLKKIQLIYVDWLKKTLRPHISSSTSIDLAKKPQFSDYYRLSSLDQITTGKVFKYLEGNNGGLETTHGTSQENNDLGFIRSRRIDGVVYTRWTSPIYVRFHRLVDNNYIPVLTWCHQKHISSSPILLSTPYELPDLDDFLWRAGFTQTLAGRSIHEF